MAGFIKGVQGIITRAGKPLARLNSYDLTMTNAIENVTDFGSEGVEREYSGTVDVTGTISGQFQLYDTSTMSSTDAGDTVVSQQYLIAQESESGSTVPSAAWRFVESSESMWIGTLLVSDWGKGNTAEGLQSFTATIQGHGRLAHYNSSSTS